MKYDLIAWGADLTPDRNAVWFQGRWYSYRDLNQRAIRLVNHLASQGIGYGDRVALLAGNHLAFFDLMLAAPKLGFVFVPFNRYMNEAQLRHAANVISPALVIADSRHATAAHQSFACPVASLDHLRGWMSNASREPMQPPELVPESAHMILFTAGSTGAPKATLIPYRQTISNAQNTAMGWDIGPEDCVIQANDCWHASLHTISAPLLSIGGRVVLMSQFEPGEYLELLQRYKASILWMLPGMYQMLIAHGDFATAKLDSVRWALCGGAPYDASVQRSFRNRGIVMMQGYGMTEIGPNCFAISAEDAMLRPDSVGRPLQHLQAKVIRSDGDECQDNEIGELALMGDALSSGYLDQNHSWSDRVQDGWFKTGDVAWCDAKGFYYVSGRRHDEFLGQVDALLPLEVERSIAACEDVEDCAVMGIPGVDKSAYSMSALAAIVMRPGAKRSAETIRAALKPRLQPHLIPPVMLFLDQMPRNERGEIDRQALRRALLPESADPN